MDLEIAFGRGRLKVDIPPSITVDQFAPATVDQPADFDSFQEAFEAGGLATVLAADRPLIIVNDAFRSTPTPQILGWLDQIDDTLLDRAKFIVATGTHPPPKDSDYEKIFGHHHERLKDRVSVHNCSDISSMTAVGNDSVGQKIFVNRAVTEADQIIAINSVEPHYFAGFTGGRKSLFPGLADLATIERNHNLANSLEAAPLRLKGNPVAEHLDELLDLIDTENLFGIQIVADAAGQPADVFCGPLRAAFGKAVTFAEKIYAHRPTTKYDVVVCEMLPPLDANLYQAQKALENCQQVVADGGTLIVVSACEQGVGSSHFFELADNWDVDTNRPKDGPPLFGSHKLSRVISMGKRFDVRLLSTLDEDSVRRVFYEPLNDIQLFFDKLSEKNNPRVAIVHDAGGTVLAT